MARPSPSASDSGRWPWALTTMGSFPGNHMTEFPATWITIDTERGEVIAEIDNPMRDPGDGSVFAAANLSIFRYAGGGQWRGEEDWYNPMKFGAMAMGWCERAQELGTITDEAASWYQKARSYEKTAKASPGATRAARE